MNANKKKLIILGYGALLAMIASLFAWAVFYTNGTSGLDSLKIAGAVLASGLAISFGVITAFTFKDDDTTPPSPSPSGASSSNDTTGQVPNARPSSVPPSTAVRP
ncbi:hypothetical protein ACIBAC_21060 [Streptomyces sp. NPDC051362]|uniref:hypothetical protein n=1 Tax=Streptomyces sp. NPDC051362 TaxID=3365651 RepID=UPI0037B8A0AA